MKRRNFLALGTMALALPMRPVNAGPAPRVVSVGGAVTECVYALGMERLLVGADTTSLYPPVAKRLPRVGYQRALSAEGLLSLAPGLILATDDAGPPAAVEQIKRAGVRWVSLNTAHTPQAPVEKLLAVGAALGQPTRAAARIRQYEADWRRTQAAVAALPGRPRAIFVMAHGGPTLNLAGRDTAADAMLALARCDNALDFAGYKAISTEALLAAAPEVIVTTAQSVEGFGGLQTLLARPGLADTPAARTRQVIAFDGLFLLGFGPRTPQAVMQLAQRSRGQA
ncbi:MAG: ABC transporter substrate-binding protein [Pseudomonadota bacterium]